MAVPSGRGRGREAADSINAKVLRRPAEIGLMQRLESLNSSQTISNDLESEVSGICEKIINLDFKSKEKLNSLSDKIKTLCHSTDDMEKCVEYIFTFAVKSKLNAHVAALFCNSIADITVEGAKIRTHLLRKLQVAYKEKNKKYLELEKFLLDVIFLCEVYQHIQIEGKCMKVLSRPINDYFGMLIDGASQKEVEVFYEKFPKCYHNLLENDVAGLDALVCKLRKQIICDSSVHSNVVVRSMLLEMFERSMTNFGALKESAKNQYLSISKPPVNVCDDTY